MSRPTVLWSSSERTFGSSDGALPVVRTYFWVVRRCYGRRPNVLLRRPTMQGSHSTHTHRRINGTAGLNNDRITATCCAQCIFW
ncbi:MAG: hypothetical protein U0264_10705 [Candidatus Kapaibacterium sp.]